MVSCYYKFGELLETVKCLIIGKGMQMGNLWVAFKVKNSKFRYLSDNPNFLDKIGTKDNVFKSYRFKNSQSQCRPGGTEADGYEFSNEDFICLYD